MPGNRKISTHGSRPKRASICKFHFAESKKLRATWFPKTAVGTWWDDYDPPKMTAKFDPDSRELWMVENVKWKIAEPESKLKLGDQFFIIYKDKARGKNFIRSQGPYVFLGISDTGSETEVVRDEA